MVLHGEAILGKSMKLKIGTHHRGISEQQKSRPQAALVWFIISDCVTFQFPSTPG
jgi:heme/copper-type cytochrome/quinol oxidase subunit 3